MSQLLRKRAGKKPEKDSRGTTPEPEDVKIATIRTKDPDSKYWVAMAVITALAASLRFLQIDYPDKVVFDEVHFGKFASYYLEGTYFFDLHPPFAKLLIALVGWLVGYDGAFKFESIGDGYSAHNVPYVAYRSLLAIQGTLTVPVMFLTTKTLGFSVPACLFSSVLVAFDNAHVVDSRLILLDSTLILTVALAMFSYVKFSTYRRQPFSQWWWTWLSLTGVSLSLVMSTKYVGALTYFTIGVAVIHELWILADYRLGLTVEDLAKHFLARAWTLIIVPFILYLFWFYVHFAILTKSGPGDSFMSLEFQETLSELPLARLSKQVNFHDIITIKHKDTDALLHSHLFDYPLRYEDGRISSNTQQVTAVKGDGVNEDVNNQWQIIPVDDIGLGIGVNTNDIVRLQHVATGGFLHTHDVASPLKPTNEEFTIAHGEKAQSVYNETLFRIRYAGAGSGKNKRTLVKTKATPLKIIHVDTVVSMWTHDDELLPEWGFGQQEVSGNKKVQDKDNIWTIDEIVGLPEEDIRLKYVPKVVRHIPFLKKWWELQGLMFLHNNQLLSEHPFASQPDAWPLAMSGVSFWNDNDLKLQIHFVGNIIGFWLEVCLLAIYVGLLLADQVTRRRNVILLTDRARSKLYYSLGFLFIGWCAHYLPFFLMNRQKFLHHYLPAHLIAALFSGGVIDFLCTNNSTKSTQPAGINKLKITVLVGLASIGVVLFFFYFRPITYGDVALTPEQVRARQWLDITLHYAK